MFRIRKTFLRRIRFRNTDPSHLSAILNKLNFKKNFRPEKNKKSFGDQIEKIYGHKTSQSQFDAITGLIKGKDQDP